MSTQVTIAGCGGCDRPSAVGAPAEMPWGSWVGGRSGAPSHGGCVAGAGVARWSFREQCRIRHCRASNAEAAPRGTADDGRHPRLPGCRSSRRPATQPPPRQVGKRFTRLPAGSQRHVAQRNARCLLTPAQSTEVVHRDNVDHW